MRSSLASLQSAVALAAGLTSLVGAVYSGAQYLRPAPRTGEMVAVVHDARTDKPVRGGTIDVLTLDDALVTTLTPTDDGTARQSLRAGAYRLRTHHPRFDSATHQVDVPAGGSVEVHLLLAQRTDAARPERTASTPVGAARRFFHRLGF